MSIEKGEIIALSNNKEYICLDTAKDDDKEYVYLLGNFKPAEIKFGIISGTDENMSIEIVNNSNQKEKILKLFQSKNGNNF